MRSSATATYLGSTSRARQSRPVASHAAIVEPAKLQPVERLAPGCVALLAARVGPARLIDNLIFGPPGATQEMLLQLALTAQPSVDTHALIPGFETEAVRLRIASCRNCAARLVRFLREGMAWGPASAGRRGFVVRRQHCRRAPPVLQAP